MDKLPKVLIVSPTFNEIESIHGLITRISQVRKDLADRYDISLLIVDDNSPDGTSNAVKERALLWITVLDRPGKGGLGPAYIAGFNWGLAKDFDYLCEIDADLSHQPEQLVRLLDALSGHDLAIGTRWMPGGSVVNWPLSRQLISKIGTGYARFALRLDLKDITSGFRAFHREVLEEIDLGNINSQGYCFQIEVALRSSINGFSIAQVPITFIERAGGVSKMSKKIVAEALWNVTKWGFGTYKYRR
ncbi:MAG: polyprenol monophosphomannose synthase [Acidobacteria bacterium]|nr:polyprenol monophosphomannose synthase [Acidobacteriota bacterium]